jgi:hypothetical protein
MQAGNNRSSAEGRASLAFSVRLRGEQAPKGMRGVALQGAARSVRAYPVMRCFVMAIAVCASVLSMKSLRNTTRYDESSCVATFAASQG